MKWFKHDSDDSESTLVVELIERHGLRGHYFWIRLNEILAKHFNSWCPGCYRFNTRILYSFFYQHIKDHRTMRKMLDLIHHRHKIYSQITGLKIYLYYPDIIKRADMYTKEEIRKRKERGEEQPIDAKELAFLCSNFVASRSKTLGMFVNDSAKNK